MNRSKWLLLLLIPMLFGFDTRNPFRTRGPFKAFDFTVGGGSADYTVYAEDLVNNLYLNSSEIGCTRSTTTDPDVVLCDDFQDGSWYSCAYTDPGWVSALNQDGWYGTIYSADYDPVNCPQGPRFPGAVSGSGAGVGGIVYAADHGSAPGGSSTSVGNMADINLGPTPGTSEHNELWIRYYVKYSPNFDIRGNYKFLSINSKVATWGGIWVGGLGAGNGDALAMCPVWDCASLTYMNPQNGGSSPYLTHNVSTYDFDAHGGNWTKVEIHIKLETTIGVTRDGEWQLWADDCGANGLSCPASPTLRADYDNVLWRCPSGGCAESDGIKSLWFEAQWDPSGGNVAFGDYTRINFIRVETNRTTPIGPVVFPN